MAHTDLKGSMFPTKESIQRFCRLELYGLAKVLPKALVNLLGAREHKVIDVDCQEELKFAEPERGWMISDRFSTKTAHGGFKVVFPMSSRFRVSIKRLDQQAHRFLILSFPARRLEIIRNVNPCGVLGLE